MQDIIQITARDLNIDETIAMLWEMIDGKCCHRDFINEVMTAINSLEKINEKVEKILRKVHSSDLRCHTPVL